MSACVQYDLMSIYNILKMSKFISRVFLPSAVMFFLGRVYQQKSSQPSPTQLAQDSKSITPIPNFFKQQTVIAPFRRLHYPHYRIIYSTYHKSPLAVHQILTKSLYEGDAPRAKFFFPDEKIQQKHFQVDQSYYYETEAFKRFNVNRGHMAAAGNYSSSQAEKFLTFAFSNVIPQNGYNNGGIWNTFERYARDLASNQNCESIQIISGPIYAKNNPYSQQTDNNPKSYRSKLIVLKQNGIPIPEKLFKILKCNSKDGNSYLNAFEFQNSQTFDNDRELESFKVDLKSVEQQTGLTFDLIGKQLKQLPGNNLNKKKKQLDHSFFFGLINNSLSLSEMVNNFRRAKEQKIFIEFEQLTAKIRTMAQNQIKQTQKEENSDCVRFQKLLRMQKRLSSLYHLDKTTDITSEILQPSYKSCLKNPSQTSEQLQLSQKIRGQFAQFIAKLQKSEQI